ncbi:MAG: transposase [Bacillaceae bacterium]|nr:transposase [Bacillaceae bacterium]
MGKRKQYDPAFRDYVVRLVVQDGRRLTEISRELEIPYDTLSTWVGTYRRQLKKAEKDRQSSLLTATEYKEKYEAERKRALELEEENEILKKAMRIFTEERK